jgi:hypothetical protein
MKANRALSFRHKRRFLRRHRWLQGGLGLGVMAMLASCVGPPPRAPAPRPVAPRPAYQNPGVPVAPRAPVLDWRDAPITPGDWHWAREGGDSVARFGTPGTTALALRCIAATRTVAIDLPSPGAAPNVTVTITTSSQTRSLSGQARGAWLETSLGARDRLLDAMAFSRGRFMVQVAGGTALYLPSWPEVTRVIEDCRAS